MYFFFFSSRRRHTRLQGDWSSDVCSSDLCASVKGVITEPRMARRKPRHGGDHLRGDLPARQELAQPGFDEDAVNRPRGVRIQRAECEDLHWLRGSYSSAPTAAGQCARRVTAKQARAAAAAAISV